MFDSYTPKSQYVLPADEQRMAWTEVDLGAIEHNVRQFKKLLDPKTLFMAVVKADAYGHGAVEVAMSAQVAGANRFGVATVNEARELRAGGILAPIHILSEPPLETIPQILKDDIIPTVTNKFFLIELSRQALSLDKTVQVHLKFNTGMNRIGFDPDEVISIFEFAKALSNLEIEGIFTHFATADVEGDWDAKNQLSRFKDLVADLRVSGYAPPLVHAANTAATVLLPESHFDMVRVGIGLYGLDASRDVGAKIELAPAMSVHARASFVHSVAMGEGVSYGLEWHAYKNSQIVVLPLGYADGVPRLASNKMEVLHKGLRYAQVGRVCMDQLMVEVPSSLDVKVGDEFILVGESEGERIALEELASAAQTINYELACALGHRLERVY